LLSQQGFFFVDKRVEISNHELINAMFAIVKLEETLAPACLRLNHFIAYSEMIIATSNYWNVIHGSGAGEVPKDDEGKQIMRVLGKNMAWLLKMKKAMESKIDPPKKEKKEYPSFIRKKYVPIHD